MSSTPSRHDDVVAPALLGVTLLAAALRLYHLDFQSLWYDETFTAWVAAQRPGDILWISLQDIVHPPLYYVVLAAWTRLVGNSEFALRVFSAGISLLGVPLVYQLGRLGWSRRAGLVAALLWAASPFAVYYGQEARMYALMTFLALASTVCLAQSVRHGSLRWLAANACLNLVGIYSHYFHLLMVVAQYAFLAWNLRRYRALFWRWFLLHVAAGLLYLPWGIPLLQEGLARAKIAWIPPLSLQSAWTALWDLSAGLDQPASAATALATGLLLAGVGLSLVSSRRHNAGAEQVLVWWYLVVPVCLAALFSMRQSVFYARYLQIVLPAYLLLAAAGLTRLGRPAVGLALSGLVVLAWAWPLSATYMAPVRHSEDWRGAMRYLSATAQTGDLVVFSDGHGSHAFWYYYTGPGLEPRGMVSTEGIDVLVQHAAGHRQAWLVVWDTLRTCQAPTILTPGADERLAIGDLQCFTGVALVRYVWRE